MYMHQGDVLEWEALEFDHKERSADWYWIAGAGVIAAALLATLTNNIMFAIIILVGGFTYLALAARAPEELPVSISPRGISVRTQLFPYHNIIAFAIDTEPPRRRIVLISATGIVRHTYVPLGDESPALIREYLSKHLDEVPYQPSFTDWVTEYL